MGVSFSRLSSECFKGVTKVFQGCLKSVSTVYPEGFKDVSRKFKVKFSRVFQGCYCISCDAGDVRLIMTEPSYEPRLTIFVWLQTGGF